MNAFLLIFITVFIAELGDKTQLATMLFSSNQETSKLTVFIASSMALILCSGLAVLAGSFLGSIINPKALTVIAGTGFIAIGLFMIISGFHTAK